MSSSEKQRGTDRLMFQERLRSRSRGRSRGHTRLLWVLLPLCRSPPGRPCPGRAEMATSGVWAVSWWVAGRPCTHRVLCQVPFFLFIVFVVYTLLPFTMRGAVAVGVVSSVSHLLVLGALMGVSSSSGVGVSLQVRGSGVCMRVQVGGLGGVQVRGSRGLGGAVVWAEGSQARGVSWSRSLEPCWQPAGLRAGSLWKPDAWAGTWPVVPRGSAPHQVLALFWVRALSWVRPVPGVSPTGLGASLGILSCVLC